MSGINQAERKLRKDLLKDFYRHLNETDDEQAEDTLEAYALINDAVAARATDIHLDPFDDQYRIRLRIDGVIRDAVDLAPGQGLRLGNQFKALARLDPIPAVSSAEGSFVYLLDDEELDLRVTAVPCIGGDKLAIRLLKQTDGMTDIKRLGISDEGLGWIRRWMDATGGMFLVAGPTGSGKTTTLYSLLHELKMNDSHVITLEDPVEYAIPGINQIQVNERYGLNFENGTLAMLRLDPDYVLIGEVRDRPSAKAAVSVATSGRALMGTLHSRDAVGTIAALRNLGLDNFEIATNLTLVAAQRLVARLCPECRTQRAPDSIETQWLEKCGREVPEKTWAPVGCPSCAGLGFKGRIGIFEIWQPNQADYEMILRHENEHAMRQALQNRDVPLMLDDGLDKAAQGLTTLRELLRSGTMLPAEND
ncbi:GspE/PulE family protein [Arsukibacterium sp.]|uniref:GspE/PulE family protein n=1 Tax=Arsukibacterium sp. TaxID=1977258 RepID=UPI00299D2BB2|nr:GspE/PulE family protein [Arsukibacterium sp.]MDX1678542.1 GspE/PulE family protein [Arsukibacterium sp.]